MNKRFWDEDGWTQRTAHLNRRMRASRQGHVSYWPTDCRPSNGIIAGIRFNRLMRTFTQ